MTTAFNANNNKPFCIHYLPDFTVKFTSKCTCCFQ